jgi:hypothetical protein
MVEKHRENPGDSTFQIRFIERDGGYFFELEQLDRPGTVALCSGPYNSFVGVQEAGAGIVRDMLRARIQAAGVRGGEPAPDVRTTWHPGDPLEGEQPCMCLHTDGDHFLGANGCAVERCSCEEFLALVPSDEAVRS